MCVEKVKKVTYLFLFFFFEEMISQSSSLVSTLFIIKGHSSVTTIEGRAARNEDIHQTDVKLASSSLLPNSPPQFGSLGKVRRITISCISLQVISSFLYRCRFTLTVYACVFYIAMDFQRAYLVCSMKSKLFKNA